jgi:uncharacterized protein
MQIDQILPEGRLLVQSYWSGGFTVSDVRHHGGLIVLSSRADPLDAGSPDDLSSDRLDLLRPLAGEGTIELLIIGMGGSFQPCPAGLRATLRGWGLAVEAMATPAACRTYNVLAADGRRVAAALIPIA